eukprot:GHUV01017520.1.p1 GENE.GHUV01017520.1~~GHUV01017520.1.p1  ORF type:complete len:582 (+),score=86.31 GHUV01017520.1:114-1748(+)
MCRLACLRLLRRVPKATILGWYAVLMLQLAGSNLIGTAAGSCPRQAGNWIDSSTPAEACTKSICTGSYAQCSTVAPAKEDLVLVFSDEFNRQGRDFIGQDGDRIWAAMDMYYSSDFAEEQNYKPDKVTVSGGALRLTMVNESSEAIQNSVNGPVNVRMNKTSGMVQSWNKFCFTGGLVEFSIKLPGSADVSGLWGAAWLEGNLGRAGYLRSTAGRWPYSYDTCAGSGRLAWSAADGQRVNRCTNSRGRGAPEIDVLEYGIFAPPGQTTPVPTFVHTMQMGPIAPPLTSFMLPDASGQIPGIRIPGAVDPARATYLSPPYGVMNKPGFPRAGSDLTDTYSGLSKLGPQHFDSYHTYSVLWEPGEHIRWYLDDHFLFEVNKEALRAQTNSAGDSIGDRLIPQEAMYFILNLAMSNKSWSKVSPDLKLPATMSVDYVRVYQRQSAVNVGCSPPDYPTQEEIACNKDEYLAPGETRLWNLGACGHIGSKDNVILLGFSVAVAFAALAAGALWWLFTRVKQFEKEQAGKLCPEEEAALRVGNKEAGFLC